MAIQIQQISDIGAASPIGARLGVQTIDFLKWARLDEEQKSALVDLYVKKLMPRLAACDRARQAILNALLEDTERVRQNQRNDNRLAEIPFVPDLVGHVENFLYGAKNYLRDLLKLFRVVYGCELDEAKSFGDLTEKGVTEIAEWAAGKFGADDQLVTMLRDEHHWTTELMRKRNAVEHPGQRSGTLVINNVAVAPDGRWVKPTWTRDTAPATDILGDMEIFVANLLMLAEDVLADMALRTSRISKAIGIGEIPEHERDPKCPVRLTTVFVKPPVPANR